MGIFRSNRSNATAAEAARLKSRNDRRNHFDATVRARVYPSIPSKKLETGEGDALLAFASTNQFVETVHDYAKYDAQGFNPEVDQLVVFQSVIREDDQERITHSVVRHLGAQTAPMTGPIFGQDENGKRSEESIGSWELKPATRQVTVTRARNRYFCEYEGQRLELEYKQTFGASKSRERHTFSGEIDRAALDPTERIPVEVVRETFQEEANVLVLGERLFGHRNLLGTLVFTSGGKTVEHILMNVDEKTIARRRTEYYQKAEAWADLSSEDRRNGRRNWNSKQGQMRPRMAFESYIAYADGILKGEDKFFIELKQLESGELIQKNMPISE